MRNRNLFTQKKKLPTIPIKIALLIFAALTIAMFLSTLTDNLPEKEEKQRNTSYVNHKVTLTDNNYFYGLKSYQDQGNDILDLSFGNLTKSNVSIKDSDDTIQIEVNGIQNAAEYENVSFLDKNISVEQSGQSLLFTFNKSGLSRRYLLQQHDNSIRLKLFSPSLVGKRITIDPGHGGVDPGAIGPTGLLEKDVVLDISLRLHELLKKAGADVALTRDSDQRAFPGTYRGDLEQRAEFATEFDSDMLVSIHNNASIHPSARGIETLFNSRTVNSSQSMDFAIILQKHLTEDLNGRNRGIVDRNIELLRPNNFVSVLTEIFFITNPEEEKIMKEPDFVDKDAQSIFNAIKDYYNN